LIHLNAAKPSLFIHNIIHHLHHINHPLSSSFNSLLSKHPWYCQLVQIVSDHLLMTIVVFLAFSLLQ
jgi:hypothetical protein